jgi:hypothetical protein
MVKVKKVLPSASLSTSFCCEEGIHISINGKEYNYKEGDVLDRLVSSARIHMEENNYFSDNITLCVVNNGCIAYEAVIDSAAFLCAFSFIDRNELFGIMTGDICD